MARFGVRKSIPLTTARFRDRVDHMNRGLVSRVMKLGNVRDPICVVPAQGTYAQMLAATDLVAIPGTIWRVTDQAVMVDYIADGVNWTPRAGGKASFNTTVTGGDSLTANGLLVTGSTFIARASEGSFVWFDAFLGGAMTLVANLAVGGKTCQNMIDEQLPVLLAMNPRPKYFDFTVLHNDIYAEGVSVATAYSRFLTAMAKITSADITPIWSTVWGKIYDSVATPKAKQLNALLREFARNNECGLFWDGEYITNDPSDSNNQGRLPLASNYYDSATHPNVALAFRIGQWKAAQLGPRIRQPNSFMVGTEDVTFSGASSNLLSNPGFVGSGAASGTGVTGVFPTGWKVDWPTRAGSGSAACAIVNITDPTTGLAIAQGVQLTLSGAASSGDVLRIYQSDAENAALRTSLSTGNVFQAESVVSVASGANLRQLAMRMQTNTSESSWWGLNQQTAVDLPATIPACAMRTFPMTVLGSGVAAQARHDLRLTFSGAGAGTVVTYWKPRARKVS